MNIIRFLAIVFALSFTVGMKAKDVKTMFLTTPDTIMTAVDASQRQLALEHSGSCDEAKNRLDRGVGVLFSDSNLIVFQSSKVRVMEYRMLRTETGDSLLCFIDTYMAPDKESVVTLYDMEWKPVCNIELREIFAIAEQAQEDEGSSEASPLICDFPLVSATFDESDETAMIVTSRKPMVDKDEKSGKKGFEKQIKVKWNGKIFK